MKRVLFLCHQAGRGGATLSLLHLLRWLKETGRIECEIAVRDEGDLIPELETLAPVHRLEERPKLSLAARAARRITPEGVHTRVWPAPLERQLSALAGRGFDLVYSNTATNGRLLRRMARLGCPVLAHIHELEYPIRHFYWEDFQGTVEQSRHYIAASHAVRRNLVQNHGIAESSIDVVHEYIPTGEAARRDHAEVRRRIREELQVGPETFLVGGAGSLGWVKGPDLFVLLAKALERAPGAREIQLVWIGGEREGARIDALRHDIRQGELEGRVRFLGERPGILEYLIALDLFALTSREDSYPLVVLEAASAGKPIVCFAESGGAPEFVEEDCGSIVPYLDLEAMADRVRELASAPDRRRRLGERARQKVSERHDVSVAAPKILEIIERCA